MDATQAKSYAKKGIKGRHSVGNGFYLRVTKVDIAYWVVRYTIHKMRREGTIGYYDDTSLARATLNAAQIKLDISECIAPPY